MKATQDSLLDILHDALRTAAPVWASELKSQYRDAGVSNKDLQTVEVRVEDDEPKIYGNRAVWDNEFGTQHTPPSGVARKYPKNSPQGASAFSEALSEGLRK